LLLLKLSLKLSELLQLGLCSPQRWWHGRAYSVRGVGRGAFTLIFIGGSFVDLPIAHEALSRWVMTPTIRVKTLVKVVVSARELAPSPWVVKPGEVSISPDAIILLEVDTRGRARRHEELREGHLVVLRQAHRGIPRGPNEVTISPYSVV
jgi:hypothetical protein